jgi:molybdopterin synthase sulfur carrier subunit
MTAKVVLPSLLRELAGGAGELTVELSHPTTLAAVLDAAFAPWPVLASRVRDERGEIRHHVNVFVDGEDVKHNGGEQTQVQPDSVVHVINAVSGG